LLAAIAAAYLAGDEQSLCEVRRRLAETTRPSSVVARDDGCLKRVLIVETSSVTLQFCVKILNEFGAVQVTSVRDSYEALGCLLKERFDAVITSLQVPTIDGPSLVTVLRTISGPNGATPVVLLTAAAGSLESTKTRPDFVVKKNLGLAVELRAILKQLARSNLQSRAAPAELKERVLKKFFLIDDSREIHVLVGLSFKRFPEIEIVGVLDPTRALESAQRNSQSHLIGCTDDAGIGKRRDAGYQGYARAKRYPGSVLYRQRRRGRKARAGVSRRLADFQKALFTENIF